MIRPRAPHHPRRWLWLLLLPWLGWQAQAADIPGMDRQVAINAREISVDRFLQQLFGQIDIPVVVDARVTGTVNGKWDDSASALLDTAIRSFQIAAYFDTAKVYVYKASDLSQKILPVSASTADKIIHQANTLGLPDRQNFLKSAGDSGLLVAGTPRFMEQVDELSVAVRRNGKQYVPQLAERLFRLKHTWAQDTAIDMAGRQVNVPGVVSILNRLLLDGSVSEAFDGALQQHGGSNNVTTSDSLARLATASPAQSAPVPPGAGSPDAGSPVGGRITRATAPAADDDFRRIVAVPGQNAVMVRDLENRMESYAQLIALLDSEPYMLEIEATIIDVNSDSTLDYGVNWRALDGDGSELLFGNGTLSDTWLQPGQNITPQALGGVLSLSIGNQAERFLARIHALQEQGDAEIVSKPHVVTLSNIEAILDTTQSFFVRVAGNDDAALFRISAGTTLRVTPHVFKDNGELRIKLMVAITDGATSTATVDQIPVVGESSISTQAIVSAGDSLLVGGLVRESRRNAEYKIPVLGDVPGLGSLFRSRNRSGSKVERLFLITPRLAWRHGFEQRMDAPALQGDQVSILSSSPRRLQATRQAMASTGNSPAPAPGGDEEQWMPVPGSEPPRPSVPATRFASADARRDESSDDWQEVVPAGRSARSNLGQGVEAGWQAVQ